MDGELDATIGRPEGGGWHSLGSVVDDGHLDRWLEELVADQGGQRDVAGAYLGSWLAGAVVGVTVGAMVLEHRVPDLGGGLWVRRHPEGWFDRVAFPSGRVHVLAGDAAAAHPDSDVVDGMAALHARCAGDLVETLTPLLDAVRRRTPYGRRGLWGAVADQVSGSALGTARLAGADGWAAWQEASAVVDLAERQEPALRTRPTPLPVTWSGGEALFQVKGTCCLYYKTHDGPLDPCGDGYCTTCPFRDDDNRLTRLRTHLDQVSPG